MEELTTQALWKEIVTVVELHFQFKLLPAHITAVKNNKLAMLRSICRKTGVQVYTADYDLGAESPFTPADIAGLVALYKSAQPSSVEAHTLFESAQLSLSNNPSQAYAYLDESASIYSQVHGSLHPSVSSCLRLLAYMYFQGEDFKQAVDCMERATIALERVYGVDHPDIVRCLMHLATYYNACGAPAKALAVLHHARRIVSMAFGEDHPEAVSVDHTIGVVLLQNGHPDASLAMFKKGLEDEKKGAGLLETAICHELMARAAHDSGDLRSALEYQRQASVEYSKKVRWEEEMKDRGWMKWVDN